MELKPKGITKAHLRAANIGEDYWECEFANYLGPQNASNGGKSYLKKLSSNKEQGIGILFGGPPGPGKTTMAVIILKYLCRAGWTCWMTSLGEIVENIQAGWKESENNTFLDTCREADFLLIDDIGKEHSGPSGFSSTVFDNLLRYRVQHRLPTFLTTNLDRIQIRNRYGDALVSLIEGKCQVIVVNGEDVRQTHLKKRIDAGQQSN